MADGASNQAGATHTGMFVAWALLTGLAGEIHIEFPEAIEKLRSRRVTPGQFFLETCDGKFTDEDLNDEGNEFTQEYFDFDRGAYMKDYDRVLAKGLPSQYRRPPMTHTLKRILRMLPSATT